MKTKVYISIPITGLDETKQREKADRIGMLLSKKGFEVINPFSIYHGERKGKPTTGQYMGADITALIDHADIIFMCSGWQHSKGCRVERFVAETYGKVIKFETVEEPERYYT